MAVISVYSQDLLDSFVGVDSVALDVEGIDLCRMGQISLVQLATPSRCFLLDLLGKDKTDPLVGWLRSVLENPNVEKIVHDCRMDSDALSHLLDINIINVHDTSCWHWAVRGVENCSLNDVLSQNGLAPNIARNSSVYANNRAFWATRPLTDSMIAWAAGDVALLFELMRQQTLGASPDQAIRAERLSIKNILDAKTAKVGTISVKNVGRFIGKGGATIRALQAATSTRVYARSDNTFVVYYQSEKSLARVKTAAGI